MSLNNLNWSLEFYEENIVECNSLLNSLEAYNDIPLINFTPLQNFKDGTLVRYQGMVQDMLNPEYYSSTYTVVNKENNERHTKSGKFRDVVHCKPNEELNEVDFTPKERLVYFCVPLPGTNSWVSDYLKKQYILKPDEKSISGVKREANDEEEEMETDNEDQVNQLKTKKNKTDQNKIDQDKDALQKNVNDFKYLPFPEENGLSCIVKSYEEEDQSNIVLNDRIEVIGFLSLSPALEAVGEETDVEDKVLNPPPSLVPRIHSILIKKLKHYNPLLKQIISYDDVNLLAETARSDLHLVLTQLLFEDEIAADYLLCHLLSRIYIRNDSHTIGKFSLNLFNLHFNDFGHYINEVIKLLVTNSHFVNLSINVLNETFFVPKKDYNTNKLCSGMLQLCGDIHLILDETQMNEGRLNNTGCLNVAALQKLCHDQEIQYDFGYYPVTYHTDIPILILSEGKSMFQTDVQVKVKSDFGTVSGLKESYEAVRLYLNDEVLNRIRIYLTAIRLKDFELGENMIQKIGEDYVSMRQQDRQVNSSSLHTLLVLSRLLALSRGRTVLNSEDWTRAVEMETERKSRLM